MLVFNEYKMRKFTLAILLFLGSVCQAAAIKYVATTGVDTPAGGSIESPWLTIQYAVSQIGSGDTIKVAAGSYYETASNYLNLNRAITATIESQSGLKDVFIKPSSFGSILRISTAAGNYTLNNLTFIPQGAFCNILIYGSVNNYSLTCNNCVFDMNGLMGTFLLTGNPSAGENLTFNSCAFTNAANVVSNNGACNLYSFGTVDFNSCSFTNIAGASKILLDWTGGNCTTLKVRNCNFNVPNTWEVFQATGPQTDSLEHLIITGNTTVDCYNFVKVADNNIGFAKICDNNIVQTDSGVGLYIGLPDESRTPVNILSGWVVNNNTITKNQGAAGNGHLLLMGVNCYGAEIAHNTFTSQSKAANPSSDYGIIDIGKYNNFHHNFVKAANAFFIDSGISYGNYGKIQYNTICATAGYCLYWYPAWYQPAPAGNIITNNILDTSCGGTYAMSDNNTHAHYDNYINYNCYYGSVRLDGTTYNAIAALTAKWKTWSDVWPGNDAHSIMADPQFVDIENDDFGLEPTSPCLNAGEPTLFNGKSTIGTWQPYAEDLISVISGYVLEPDGTTPIEGVLVQADDNCINSITDIDGYYELLVYNGWSGRVTPIRHSYVFEPNGITYTNVVADQSEQDYSGRLLLYIISGHVRNQSGVPVKGVVLTASTGGDSDITDANGYYEVWVDYNWSGRVTPTKYAYIFEPNSETYTNVVANQNEQDYSGKLLTYLISGYVHTQCGVPVKDVVLTASNGGGSGITDANGYYEVWVNYNWTGTVTPAKECYIFNPAEKVYIHVLADQAQQNYQGIDNVYDLDCDGSIGFGDLMIMSENWLDGPDLPGDFYKDEDEIVNFLDFAEFANHWFEGP